MRLVSIARSILACSASGISPISSRKMVPRCAISNLPILRWLRAGERAALVAEQLGLEQVLGNRRAVDRHERPVGAGAGVVQRPRAQLLAGAALAFEQHRGVGAGGAFDRRHHLAQGRRVADDARAAAAGGGFLFQQPVFIEQPALLERARHQQQQVIGIDGLGEEVERALLHRLDGVLDAAVRGHHDDRQLGIQLPWRRAARRCRRPWAGADRRARAPAATSRSAATASGSIARLDDAIALRLERELAASRAASPCLRRGGWREPPGASRATRPQPARWHAGTARLVFDRRDRLGLRRPFLSSAARARPARS